MPMFECKKCHEEWVGLGGGVERCAKCGTVTHAFGFQPDEGRDPRGSRSGGFTIGRMTEEDLNRRLGIPNDPPKGGGMGCVVGIVIAIVIFWLLSR